MLKYSLPPLSVAAVRELNKLQSAVNNGLGRKDRYNIAKMLFAVKSNSKWREIKASLAKFAPTGKACYYCERDRFRDIEHIKPKLHYPESCFDWENYVYACTICNQGLKSDTFAVFDLSGDVIKFDRAYEVNKPLPNGPKVLIDIRTEDPLLFLELNLTTGYFVPIGDSLSRKRGEFTRNIFDLNEPSLADIRVAAYNTYCYYLTLFKNALNAPDPMKANRIFNEIRKLNHPTVLVEMRRQSLADQNLSALFQDIPLVLGARPI